MNGVIRGIFWIGIYLTLVLAPLFMLLLSPVPAGSGFLVDLSLALGFAGTTMMAVMFVLTARFHRPTEPPTAWDGERGFLTAEMFARHLPADRAQRDYFVCGPTAMIQAVERALTGQGVPLARIHSELFDLV